MVLSPEQKKSLKARYDVLGVDRVRLELARNIQAGVTSADELAFASTWVAAEEVKSERMFHYIKGLAAVFFLLLGGTITVLLIASP